MESSRSSHTAPQPVMDASVIPWRIYEKDIEELHVESQDKHLTISVEDKTVCDSKNAKFVLNFCFQQQFSSRNPHHEISFLKLYVD